MSHATTAPDPRTRQADAGAPARHLAQIEQHGFTVVEDVLDPGELEAVRAELAPLLGQHRGRNRFEGERTERIYTLAARGPVFEATVVHPRILALVDALLQPNCLLSASQAINLLPGQAAQPLHFDDNFYAIPRPRPPVSIGTIWAIDDFTAQNGATVVLPGSHRWGDEVPDTRLHPQDFNPETGYTEDVAFGLSGAVRDDGQPIDALMRAGSVLVFAGTLWHGGGANRSACPRLAITHQYCQPWARPQENYSLAVSPAQAAALGERTRALLGYSIHPPFMGHVGGAHPRRLLATC